jgi:hypothetical protein
MCRWIAAFVMVQVGLIITRADTLQPILPLEDLVRQANYVFTGTVLKLKPVRGTNLPAGKGTIAVFVDEVIYERAGLPDLTGKEIIVESNSPKPVKVGQQRAFFTNGGQVGDPIVVREVGHLDAADNGTTLRQRVLGIIQQQIDESVQGRITSAELIVVGKVVKIVPVDVPGSGTRDDPEWYEAEIEIQSVEKGQLSGKNLSFLFTRNVEIRPEKALRLTSERPGLTKFQEGIWILHKNEVPRLGTSDRYTAADPIDFQSLDRLARIRQLIITAQTGAGRH